MPKINVWGIHNSTSLDVANAGHTNATWHAGLMDSPFLDIVRLPLPRPSATDVWPLRWTRSGSAAKLSLDRIIALYVSFSFSVFIKGSMYSIDDNLFDLPIRAIRAHFNPLLWVEGTAPERKFSPQSWKNWVKWHYLAIIILEQ